MAVSSGDIQHLQSTAVGSSGGAISASLVTSGVMNNIWPDVSDVNRLAGGTTYRKTFFKNNHATDALLKPVLYAPVLPSNMTLSLGLGVNDAADSDGAQGNMTAFGAAARVALISDGADTRVASIYGLDNAGTPVPTKEDVTLTGAVEVLSTGTFSKVYAVVLASTSGSRTVTVKQGTGGASRGSIGTSKKSCWLWLASPSTKAGGIALPDLAALQSYGCWRRLVWAAAAAVTRPNTLSVALEENA